MTEETPRPLGGPGATPASAALPAAPEFSEQEAWREVCAGWCPLFAGFRERGFSVEWHSFQCPFRLDWARSFHPHSLEICLNLAGNARLGSGAGAVELPPRNSVFYFRGPERLEAWRLPAAWHEFVTVELSRPFLAHRLSGREPGLHPLLRGMLTGEANDSAVATVTEMGADLRRMAQTLRQPPTLPAVRALWFESKVLQLVAQLCFRAEPEAELFCDRQKRVARERVEKAITLLQADLANPPDLECLGQKIGCSPFHLSRTFSAEVGMTIPQYLRALRLERAAALLRTGRHNVTEAAMAVGYSSLSHFSHAFRQHFGSCPGLYPLVSAPTELAPKPPRGQGQGQVRNK